MDRSATLSNSPVSLGNYQSETSSTGVRQKAGAFCQRLITPIKSAARHIADGICTLCRNIRSFLVNICTPLTSCFRSKSSESSTPPREQQSPPRMGEGWDEVDQGSNSAALTETRNTPENAGDSQRNTALLDDRHRDFAGADEKREGDAVSPPTTEKKGQPSSPAEPPADFHSERKA